jgi:Ca2+-binding RTX toxin-like protein
VRFDTDFHLHHNSTECGTSSPTTDPVTVYMYGQATGVGYDQLISIENAEGGSAGDSLYGDSGVNVLQGGEGNDHLDGGGGADTLDGGPGADSCTGDAAAMKAGCES